MSQNWLEVAQSARRSASLLASRDEFRSCLSRAYYAAYSKVTHALAATPGVSFPRGREGPNHPGESGTGGIRRLIETHMPGMDRDQRIRLSELVGRMYTLRCDADYRPSVSVVARDARAAVSIMITAFESF